MKFILITIITIIIYDWGEDAREAFQDCFYSEEDDHGGGAFQVADSEVPEKQEDGEHGGRFALRFSKIFEKDDNLSKLG